MQIEEQVPLAPLTTFGLGGEACYFVRVRTGQELIESFDLAREKNVHTHILGGGSNTLVPDVGVAGLVIKIEITGIAIEKETETVEKGVLIAGAGG